MTERYALVDTDGLVRNVVLWDGTATWSPPAGLTVVEAGDDVCVDWRLDGGAWSPPMEAL